MVVRKIFILMGGEPTPYLHPYLRKGCWGNPPPHHIFNHFFKQNSKTMKNYIITSATCTDKGNLSAYTSKGERIHIYSRQLTSLGLTNEMIGTDKVKGTNPITVDNPLFCIAEMKTFNARKDDQGNSIPFADGSHTMTRLTALSVFTKKTQLIGAHVEENLLEQEIQHETTKIATSRGLNTSDVSTLANASV